MWTHQTSLNIPISKVKINNGGQLISTETNNGYFCFANCEVFCQRKCTAFAEDGTYVYCRAMKEVIGELETVNGKTNVSEG